MYNKSIPITMFMKTHLPRLHSISFQLTHNHTPFRCRLPKQIFIPIAYRFRLPWMRLSQKIGHPHISSQSVWSGLLTNKWEAQIHRGASTSLIEKITIHNSSCQKNLYFSSFKLSIEKSNDGEHQIFGIKINFEAHKRL